MSGLIPSSKHTRADLDAWERFAETCSLRIGSADYERRKDIARNAVTSAEVDYVSVSWGKDSVVLAHLFLTLRPRIPIVHISIDPWETDDTLEVRDVMLDAYEADYREYHLWVGGEDTTYSPALMFSLASKEIGPAYASGLRGDESLERARRLQYTGEVSRNVCTPLIRWDGFDVFAYAMEHGLPIHPSYAFLMGGTLSPERCRVAEMNIDGRGNGFGRDERTARYYGAELATALRLAAERPEMCWYDPE